VELRGGWPGLLLLPVNKGGRILQRRITPQSIYDTLRRLAERAGVAAFSPHDLRRSFVSDLLDAGADLAAVQALAGHASPTTTARYDRRGERAKRKAADLLAIPTPHAHAEKPTKEPYVRTWREAVLGQRD
jgi:integrase/recombinase XerD